MSPGKQPFNISLLPPVKTRVMGIYPVSSADIYISNTTEFNPQGLYSIDIFGPIGSKQRQENDSYIDMRTPVMHPLIFRELSKLKTLYGGIMDGTAYAIWDNKTNDFIKSDIIDGKTGYSFFMTYFNKLIFSTNDSTIRDLRIDLIEKYREGFLYRYLVVMPAGLRDIRRNADGRDEDDPINNLYRKILRTASTISVYNKDDNNPSLDTVRWGLQRTFNEIFDYIQNILEGKQGFLQAKWAARNVHGGTRNVITDADPAPRELGTVDAFNVNDTGVGLHQYMKSTTEITVHSLKTELLSDIINGLSGSIPLVDGKYHLEMVEPSSKTRTLWGTDEGLESLINSFSKQNARHKPVIIEDRYVLLIYRDGTYYKTFKDINELPEGWDKSNVKPITWAELFYLSIYKQSRNTPCLITRYPIAGTGSIFPSNIYLHSTIRAEKLIKLDANFQPIKEDVAIRVPIKGEPFLDSMNVHPSKFPGLNADVDGDIRL